MREKSSIPSDNQIADSEEESKVLTEEITGIPKEIMYKISNHVDDKMNR